MTVSGITDCYSTKYEMTVDKSPVNGQRRVDSFHETYRCKKTIDLPVEVAQILDCWCECMVDSSRVQDNTLQLDGRVIVCMLTADTDGGIIYHEKPVETQYQRATPHSEREIVCEPSLRVESIRCSLSAPAAAEAEVELSVRGDVYEQVSQSLVCNMEPDESRPKEGCGAALIVYFAGEGEQLWDIAKRYNTDAEAVAATNELPDGVLHKKTMLLIPSVVRGGNRMEQNIYKDIAERTGGNIYVGVVGPVRTGKSTFIKRIHGHPGACPTSGNDYRPGARRG